MKKLRALAASVAIIAFAGSANAQEAGFGQTLTTVKTGFLGPLGDFLLAFAFVAGVISVMVAIAVLWKNGRNSHDPNASPMTAAKWGIAGAFLLALPVAMGLSVDTFFGDGGTRSSIEGQLRTVE